MSYKDLTKNRRIENYGYSIEVTICGIQTQSEASVAFDLRHFLATKVLVK